MQARVQLSVLLYQSKGRTKIYGTIPGRKELKGNVQLVAGGVENANDHTAAPES